MSNLQDFYFMMPKDFKKKIKEKYGADGLVIDDCVFIPFYQVMDRLEKLEQIEQIIDDCDLEAWEVLEKIKEVLKNESNT